MVVEALFSQHISDWMQCHYYPLSQRDRGLGAGIYIFLAGEEDNHQCSGTTISWSGGPNSTCGDTCVLLENLLWCWNYIRVYHYVPVSQVREIGLLSFVISSSLISI